MGVSKGEQGEREREDTIEEKRGGERKWKIGWEERKREDEKGKEKEGHVREGREDRRKGEKGE